MIVYYYKIIDKYYGTGLSLHQKDATNKDKWQTNKLGVVLANGGKSSCHESYPKLAHNSIRSVMVF